jgi:hypothetical protein
MSATVPFIAVSALIGLSLIARQWSYLLTSTALLFMAGALAAWFLILSLMLG